MAKKKPARPARPAKSAEPTTAQLRQEYYARRAAEQALEDLGLRLDERRTARRATRTGGPTTRDALDRLEIIHAVWRFTGLTGYAPEPEDFDPDRGWPTADEVEAVFGSWDKMLDESGIDDGDLRRGRREGAERPREAGGAREGARAPRRQARGRGQEDPGAQAPRGGRAGQAR